MGDCGKNIALIREGTNQQGRFLKALDPKSVRLNDFTIKDWMQFAYNFAKHVNYFDIRNPEVPEGNWQAFFKDGQELEELMEQLKNPASNLEPHLALFIAFLYLLNYPQKQFNQLTKRHLDFYCTEILRIKKKTALPDQVFVIFELAKKATEERLEKGTELLGGKDLSGKERTYKTTEDLNLNKASISTLKNCYTDSDGKISFAKKADSYDGQGGDFPNSPGKWYPFGFPGNKKNQVDIQTDLAEAEIGFALASPILLLKEGTRTVTITLELNEESGTLENKNFKDDFQLWLTGEKEWLGPFNLQKAEGLTAQFQIQFKLSKDTAAVVPFDSEIHKEDFKTDYPICKLLLSDTRSEAYDVLSALPIKTIRIEVHTEEITNLQLENDFGPLDPKKPFYPFGRQPGGGETLWASYPELKGKQINGIDITVNWKGLPVNLETWYSGYDWVFKDESFKALFGIGNRQENVFLFKDKPPTTDRLKESDRLINSRSSIAYSLSEIGQILEGQQLKLTSQDSFQHQLYPQLYAEAMIKKANGEYTAIPREPYTPQIDGIKLAYTATSENHFNEGEKSINLFHIHPFGQAEVHAGKEGKVKLIPTYPKENGQLYIGLKDAKPLQTISLLIQLAEGTEHPDLKSAPEVNWYVLGRDRWIKLTTDYLIKNDTDNFLKSGIVRFSLPKAVTTDNSLLPAGLIWVKAELNGKYNAVCQCYSINIHAVKAEFFDDNNELSHLKEGLPSKDITKLKNRRAKIKSVDQPYPSFGGIGKESDAEYYQRISERLRHKNRAVTLWDYEHLVLQNFPEVYKVKALNHTSKNSYLTPGAVMLVVLPNIVDYEVYDLFKPRLSKAKLNEIKSFIEDKAGMQVAIAVENPTYEEIKIEARLALHPGYDERFYLKKAEEDLIRFLSPWAFRETAEIEFDQHLQQSMAIYYLEKRPYIDYVERLELFLGKERKPLKSIHPNDPRTILVSNKTHKIEPATKKCQISP